jgi:sugar diacid utilization regulator
VTTVIGERVYALLSMPAGAADEDVRLRRFASSLASTVHQSTGVSVNVAIGPVAASVDDVPLSRRVADRVLAVMASRRPEPPVSTFVDVRAAIVLNEVAERERHMLEYYGGPADLLIQYDREHGTDYAETLFAHLEAFGQTDLAARRLMVHENTMRYRMRRLVEVFGLTFDNPDDRLLAWLQLRTSLGRRPS